MSDQGTQDHLKEVAEEAAGKIAEDTANAVGKGASGGNLSDATGQGPARNMEPIIDRVGKQRNIALLFLLGVVFVIAAALAAWYLRDYIGEPVMLAIAGALAGIGIFFLFLLTMGFIHLSANRRRDEFTRNLVNGMESGILVSDHEGRIIFANRAYGELTGATDSLEVAGVETVFAGNVLATEAIYRLARQAREGATVSEEIRLPNGLRSESEGARWFRLRVRKMAHEEHAQGLMVWQLSDITEDRRAQERAFQELQHAINYLDHAPAGFFSSNSSGEVVYLNATLADWLGVDLALFRQGSLKLKD